MPANTDDLEKKLQKSADKLNSDSGLATEDYSPAVLGLIFLCLNDNNFTEADKNVQAGTYTTSKSKYISSSNF